MWDQLAADARAALPEGVWRYYAAGTGDEVSLQEAPSAWRDLRFHTRVLRDVSVVDTTTEILGTTYRQPFGIAPTALQRCADPEGEVAMARAAASLGVPHVVSSNAGHPFAAIDDVGAPWWVQTYLTEDRGHCMRMLDAAVAARAAAIVLTADLPFPGAKPGLAPDAFDEIDLSWHRVNYGPVPEARQPDWAKDLTYADVEWLRQRTGLPVVVKGLLHPDDAEICIEAGAAAVWVSNHGGRQLDRAVATATALPAVVAAVAGRVPVFVDGGIRTADDVLAALSLGANAVFLGRVPLLALAAGGQARVRTELGEVAENLARTLALAGLASPRRAPQLLANGL